MRRSFPLRSLHWVEEKHHLQHLFLDVWNNVCEEVWKNGMGVWRISQVEIFFFFQQKVQPLDRNSSCRIDIIILLRSLEDIMKCRCVKMFHDVWIIMLNPGSYRWPVSTWYTNTIRKDGQLQWICCGRSGWPGNSIYVLRAEAIWYMGSLGATKHQH